ncbi:hypothetical protein [Amycolatopsis sp. MtRt-6]|uniref:hypothetical protein n=1 Tax=Amycolatopsis sp. MtRt-6 TaxID=2792782 RepID=UPI001A8D3B8D|nr:hypothetical protein [Amycolatopsis sp. MtRt-6]
MEIKGSWHTAVSTAQRDQLANRYLPAETTDAGVYVVGWYPIDLWSSSALCPFLESLRSQAGKIFEELGRRTLPYVLTITRAASSQCTVMNAARRVINPADVHQESTGSRRVVR